MPSESPKRPCLVLAALIFAAGIIAVLLGAVLVFFVYPKHEEEQALLQRYHEEDA